MQAVPAGEFAVDDPTTIDADYLDLQEQISSGQLPVSRETAALLAAIHICIDENWPANRLSAIAHHHIHFGLPGPKLSTVESCSTATPWDRQSRTPQPTRRRNPVADRRSAQSAPNSTSVSLAGSVLQLCGV
jgi:hypothetical protein